MKKLLALLAFFSCMYVASAQQIASGTEQEIRRATDALSAKYHLSAEQTQQMYDIQARKAKNFAEIAPFQSSDPERWRAKARGIQTGTLASIRRILQGQEQIELYQKTQGEIRALHNQKHKEMAARQASKAEIDAALLDIYAE